MSSPFDIFDQLSVAETQGDSASATPKPPVPTIERRLASVEKLPAARSSRPSPEVPDPVITARAMCADPNRRAYFGARGAVYLSDLAHDFARCFDSHIRRGQDGIWVYSHGVWSPVGDTGSMVLAALMGDDWSAALEERVLAFIARQPEFPTIMNDPRSDGWWNWVNFTNGHYEWTTDRLVPHSPERPSTWQLTVPFRSGPAPMWEQFLQEVLPADMLAPDANGVAPWQEDLGYLLLPGNPWHSAFLLRGAGRNGKGVWMSVIQRIAGRYSGVSLEDIASSSRSRFRTHALYGSPLNVCGEIDAKYMGETAMFKALTGGDPMLFERKFGMPFTAIPWATFVFSANKDFRASDNSVAFWDRWQVRWFPRYIPEEQRDPSLAERIYHHEGPQIAGLAMAGLRNLMARGRFVETPSSAEAKQRFRMHSDHVSRFIDERCRFTSVAKDTTTRTQLLQSYKQWCADEQEQYPVRATELYEAVRSAAVLSGIPEDRIERKVQGTRGFGHLSIEDRS